MHYAHETVMPTEVSEYLAVSEMDGTAVDATIGEGGHSAHFLTQNSRIRVIGVDADETILERSRQRLAVFGDRVTLYSAWFDEFFADYPPREDRPTAVLFDFGISSYHYTESGRGFSFAGGEPLDMRLRGIDDLTAEEIVNGWSKERLADLFFHYGDERFSRRIAERIVRTRQGERITTTDQLAEIVSRSVPASYRHRRLHPATRCFQALRIAVNDELGRIERGLAAAFRRLTVGGRMACISFHSLEDRAVKQFFRGRANACICPPEEPMCKCGGVALGRILTRKPLTPANGEIRRNPRARSAKLRAIEKIDSRGDEL